MDIMFVVPGYKPYMGGTERIVEQLGKQYLLTDRVKKVGVLTTFMDFNHLPPREDLSLPAVEVIDGFEVHRVRFVPRRLRFFYSLPAGLFSLEAKKVLDAFRPHVVHFTLSEWFVANLWIYWLTRSQSRHMFTLALHEPPERLRYLLMHYGNVILGRCVDMVQVHSSFIKKRAMECYRVPEEKIHVVPLGCMPSSRPRSVREQLPAGRLTLLAVGRLCPDKGQFELVRVFHSLIGKVHRSLRLILVGGDGGDRAGIEDYIRRNGLENHIELRGFLSEEALEDVYRQADVFVLTTRVESFGLVFAEAQSHGLPVIGYRIGPLEAVFRKGAILVEPFEQDAVAEAIRLLADNDNLRNQLGLEAMEYALENFSWKRAAHDMVNLYGEMLSGNQGDETLGIKSLSS